MLAWKEEFLRSFRTQFSDTGDFIRENRNERAGDEIEKKLNAAIATFNEAWA